MSVAKLLPSETELHGQWVTDDNNKIVTNPVSQRIDNLIETYLILIGKDHSGWNTLYYDPTDKRYWEHIYLSGHIHGGGPPSLVCLSEAQAKLKYSDLFDSK